MYLRATRRVNKDGTVVSYSQLAHNERHPHTGSLVAKVIHNFGRVDKVDHQALARLVASISRSWNPGRRSPPLTCANYRSSSTSPRPRTKGSPKN